MFQRIAVAWDGSELAERALGLAVEFAARYEAEVVAASVVAPASPSRQRLTDAFADARAAAERRRVPISHEIVEARRPIDGLLSFTHDHGFDLLVIGHHRDPHAGALMLHGLTEHLVSAAQIPVLVVAG